MRMGLEMGLADEWSQTLSALLSKLCFNPKVELPVTHGGGGGGGLWMRGPKMCQLRQVAGTRHTAG